MPTKPQRGRAPKGTEPAKGWEPDQGLIDQLLHLRTFPDPGVLLLAATEVSPVDGLTKAWQGAVDAALDILVPELKKIVLMSGLPNNVGAISKMQVEQIIGRVPLTRSDREGWS